MSRRGCPCSGFTTVELLVGIVLGLAVMTLGSLVLTKSFNAADRSMGKSGASASVDQATLRLQQDIGAVRARDRASAAAYDPEEFRTAITTGGPLRGMDADGTTPVDLDVHDVQVAAPHELAFQLPGSGGQPQCVWWHVSGGALVRERVAYDNAQRSCPSRPASSGGGEFVIAPATSGPPLAAPFQYVLAQSRGDGTCGEQVVASAQDGDLGRLVAVAVNLHHTAGRKRASATSGRVTRVPIRSRGSGEYQRALGCAA